MNKKSTVIDDFILITEIGQELSNSFSGITTPDIRKAKSTHYLAKMLNANFTILSLIHRTPYSSKSLSYQDNSSIYSLLRNQVEICNIYWYLIDDEYEESLFKLKLSLLEYHDSVSCEKVYNTLFHTKEIEEYYNERKNKHLLDIESSPIFLTLAKSQREQIKKGNISSLYTQFDITQKRCINMDLFKAFYKLFSTHTHSSPTAIKNLVFSHRESSSLEFDGMFFSLSLLYTLSFIAEMILSVGNLWEVKFQKHESEDF